MSKENAYAFQQNHTLCKHEVRRLKMELKIKWNQISMKRVGKIDEDYYIYIDPEGYRGSFRGCCRFDALRNCLKEMKRNLANDICR